MEKIKLVIVIIKFYFNLLSVHEAFFASLAWADTVHAILLWVLHSVVLVCDELLQFVIVRLF